MPEGLLEIRRLTKQFSGVTVVDKVDLHLNAHEIVGLVGENGAGKSTIMNILSGVVGQWSGRITLSGATVNPRNYHEATLLGIARVFQEQALVPTLKVYENMFLSHENRFRKWGCFLDRRQMAQLAQSELSKFNLDINVTRPAGDYDFSTRQAIEIAKACHLCSMLGSTTVPVILLDEPTTALTSQEIDVLFQQLRRLKARASMLFISHRLSEVLEICDRVCVLKDGRMVAEVDACEIDESQLHELMVGRKRDSDYYQENQQQQAQGEPILRAEDLTHQSEFARINLDIRPGEILGIGGVLGSGKNTLGRALAGLEKTHGGRLWVAGQPRRGWSFMQAMGHGIGYVPRERHLEGIILYLPVIWNMTLAHLRSLSGWLPGLLSLKQERQIAETYIRRLRIKPPDARTLAVYLSGGNQQKVVMAKWLTCKPRILILDNPTRGMDAGAKEEIYALLRELTRQGMAIILISDELLELIGLSNRILILKDGRITHQVDAPPQKKPSERELVQFMV